MTEHVIGLMSGTSMDGVDGVLLRFDANGLSTQAHASAPLPPTLRHELLALNQSGPDELHRAALAANALMRVYAQVTADLLRQCSLGATQVRAIGAHGQTVRHRPGQFDGTGYTLQLHNAALLAELTGIDVVADFRSRDVAAGGQGAPLVPLFHQQVFGQPGRALGVLNLGGIANLSVLRADGSVLGFDCGPGNVLLDLWCQRHTGQAYDADGAWAARGHVIDALLAALLREPFLHLSPPKSTGRDLFHADWLAAHLRAFDDARPQDVQATLTAFTAEACAQDVRRHVQGVHELLVCGGGALNGHLMHALAEHLPGVAVRSSAERGLPPLQVEAAAFAWLARQAVRREPGNLPAVTGACGARVLGAVYPR